MRTLSIADAHRWNNRYIEEKEFWWNIPPKQFLINNVSLLPSSGQILDAASGVSTSGSFLAQKGFTVYSLDISFEGLKMAQEKFRKSGSKFLGAVVDLSTFQLPESYFDVILNFCFLDRSIFPKYRKALEPGGLIFFENFIREENDSKDNNHYLLSNELESKFQDYEILFSEETLWKKSKSDSRKRVAQLIARKPYVKE